MAYPRTCAICALSNRYSRTRDYCVLWGRLVAPSGGCECWQEREPRRTTTEAQERAKAQT